MPSGRKIICSPTGYGPFSRLRRWATRPVGLATVTRAPPCTRKNGPITGRTGISEMASNHIRVIPVDSLHVHRRNFNHQKADPAGSKARGLMVQPEPGRGSAMGEPRTGHAVQCGYGHLHAHGSRISSRNAEPGAADRTAGPGLLKQQPVACPLPEFIIMTP